MDDLLPVLLSFPPHPSLPHMISDQQYDESIKFQVEGLKKLSIRTLLQTTASGEHMLNVINPALNSVPYVFVLLANINAFQNQSSNALDGATLWEKIVMLLEEFDPIQIRYVGMEFSQVITATANLARRSQQPALAISPITSAILRLDKAAATLTSFHTLIARLSLESRMYSLGVPVLERPILHFPGLSHQSKPKFLCSRDLSGPSYITPESGLTEKLKYHDVLEYFLLGGTIFIALHEWEKALDLLESAVAYPVKENAVSKMMVDAYKKWTLVNVLLYGRAGNLPGTVNGNAAKAYHTIAKPYDVVTSLFESASASRLQAEVNVGHDIWKDDGNLGLMLFVLASYQKFQIRRLANIYHTIAISEITQMTTSAETGNKLPSDQATETLIHQMITDGELDARISQLSDSQATLSFNATGPVLLESDIQLRLSSSLERIRAIASDIKSTDQRLTYDKDYLKWAHKQKKLDRSGLGDGDEISWNPVEDEDLMSGNF